MAKKKEKTFNVSVNPDDVMYTSINTSKNGYNSARMVIKSGDNEYMSISYEWEGKGIPGFAMDLMGFMKDNNKESSGVWEGQEDTYVAFSEKHIDKRSLEGEKEEGTKDPDPEGA